MDEWKSLNHKLREYFLCACSAEKFTLNCEKLFILRSKTCLSLARVSNPHNANENGANYLKNM